MASKTKVAVLDDYANTSTPYLSPLSDELDIHYFPDTLNPKVTAEFDQLVARLRPFEIISTMRERTKFDRTLLEKLPNLKVLMTTGMWNLGIDKQACTDHGIQLVGTAGKHPTPGYDTTNEQNWALILGLAKRVAENDLRVKSDPKGWQQGGTSMGLAGKTLGLLGLGNLGTQCAATGVLGFGMKAIAWSTNLTQEKADQQMQKRGLSKAAVTVVSSLDELVRNADVLSVHLILSERSKGILGRDQLALLKETALLVNTSRGPLIDEEAVLEIVRDGRVRGFASDVWDTEPLPTESPWRSQSWGQNGTSHVLISPHVGYVEDYVLNTMYQSTATNLREYLAKEPFTNKMN